MRYIIVTAAVVLMVLGLPVATPAASILAGTGFESPPGDYVDGATVIGKGAGESGWTDAWWGQGYREGSAIEGIADTQSAVTLSGDLALKMRVDTSSGSRKYVRVKREFTDVGGAVQVDFDIRIDGSTAFNYPVYIYIGPDCVSPAGSGPDTGAAVVLRFDQEDTDITVADGDGTGGVTYEDSGLDYTLNDWNHITVGLDTATQTYDVWVDGTQVSLATPLGFRRQTSFVDEIMFMTGMISSTPAQQTVYVDNVQVSVPEPAAVVLLGTGLAIGLAFVIRRRRQG
jgi:hypothetical protein